MIMFILLSLFYFFSISIVYIFDNAKIDLLPIIYNLSFQNQGCLSYLFYNQQNHQQ